MNSLRLSLAWICFVSWSFHIRNAQDNPEVLGILTIGVMLAVVTWMGLLERD